MTDDELRDKLASEEVFRLNHEDAWVQYEMRKCGEIGFKAGWNAARANQHDYNNVVNLRIQDIQTIKKLNDEIDQLQAQLAARDARIQGLEANQKRLYAENRDLSTETIHTHNELLRIKKERDELRAEVERLKEKHTLALVERDCAWLKEEKQLRAQAEKLAEALDVIIKKADYMGKVGFNFLAHTKTGDDAKAALAAYRAQYPKSEGKGE